MAQKNIALGRAIDQLPTIGNSWKSKALLRAERRNDVRALRTMRQFMTAENFEKHELYFKLHPDESPDDWVWGLFEESGWRIDAEMSSPTSAVEC